MIMNKYRLTDESIVVDGVTLFRIEALKDMICFAGFPVKVGDKGGFIEKESNLSHKRKSWVSENAKVFGNAQVYGNARIAGLASVYGNAQVYGNARVGAWICVARNIGDAQVYDNAKIYDCATVYGNARICDDTNVCGFSRIDNVPESAYM